MSDFFINHKFRKARIGVLFIILFLVAPLFAVSTDSLSTDVVSISTRSQHRQIKPATTSAIELKFELKQGWHFYANRQNAPGRMNLDIQVQSPNSINFSTPIFPPTQSYQDPLQGKTIDVYSDKFSVYLPYRVKDKYTAESLEQVGIKIKGALCSQTQCRMPDFDPLEIDIRINPDAAMTHQLFSLPQKSTSDRSAVNTSSLVMGKYSIGAALVLAFIAGILLNVMPCVWPVLPLIVMRLVEQARQSKTRSLTLGLAFCLGILLFFAALAGANIILKVFFGMALQWGDQFRQPTFVAAIGLLMVVLSLFMFGLFEFALPGSVSEKQGQTQTKGFTGSVAMGFLAAVLSTPCSFAILAAAFAWAQAQTLILGTTTILIIGFGMALPYFILTMMPALLKRIPRPGRWMELLKQTLGFVLLGIGIKFIAILPDLMLESVLYFALILAFCIWMWGKWITFRTGSIKKWLIRSVAIIIAVLAGWWLFAPKSTQTIDWQKYDQQKINHAIDANRPVLIKFTADWCLSCKVVERTVYSRQDIVKLIESQDVLPVKADTTYRDNPATKALKQKYSEPGVPVTILILPQGPEVRWRNINFGDKLKKQLESIKRDTGNGQENNH